MVVVMHFMFGSSLQKHLVKSYFSKAIFSSLVDNLDMIHHLSFQSVARRLYTEILSDNTVFFFKFACLGKLEG